MRKVFLDDLPKHKNGGIDWKECVGEKINFVYDTLQDSFYIADCKPNNGKNNELLICYNNVKKWMLPNNIKRFQFIPLQEKNNISLPIKYNYPIGTIIKDDKRHIKIINNYIGYSNGKQKGRIKLYDFECLKCGYVKRSIREYEIKRGCGCPVCGKAPKIVVEGINDIPTTAPWMIPYFKGGYDEAKLYTFGSAKRINPVCQDCGKQINRLIQIHQIHNEKKVSCPCSGGISFPNKVIYFLFIQLHNQNPTIFFTRELYPEWCIFTFKNKIRRGFYDLYFEISERKFIVEMDGALGHGIKNTKQLSKKDSSEIDKIKDSLASKENIEVIRIDCVDGSFESIKENILHSKLSSLFDLSNIKWKQIEESSQKNLIKEICKEYNNGTSRSELISKYMIDRHTLLKYLKQGSKFNWCNYNESIKKQVYKIDLNGNIIEKYDSISEASKINGLKAACICNCCKHKQKTAGGYIWKYADEVDNIKSA